MLREVRSYIERFRLLSDDRLVLVGLSGGADSVALLAVLVELGYSCVALHCNFHLRGAESDRDEAFAREFAGLSQVPFHKKDFDTVSYAKEKRLSIEMAARELRYAWFEDMRMSLGGQAIAVAHHRDDSVETFLMNLSRGSGIRGLTGIRPKNGFIVRPLLGVSRDEILAWLAERGYPYVVDSSNLSDVYTRNFIRLSVLPLLERINPSVRKAISRSAEHLAAVETIYLSVLKKAREEVITPDGDLSVEALTRYPAPETVLYELLKDYGFTRVVSENIFAALSKESGKTFDSRTHRLVTDRGFLRVAPLVENEERSRFLLDLKRGACDEPVRLSFQECPLRDFTIEKDKRIAYFDYDKLTFPLYLRRWKEGDWFVPFGMRGRKKLSDYFSDHKYSRIDKERAWLLCSGDSVIWLVGERTDDRFKIGKSTRRALVVNFLG